MPDTIEKVPVQLTVNGRSISKTVEPRMLLVDFIRQELRLTGTHIGCESTYCGACTLLLNGDAVKSCTMFAVQADQAEILTVEGLAKEGKLHPLQEAFSECHGLQCGYCTPGLLMASYHLLAKNSAPTEKEIRKGIAGNVCRCTGYQNVIKSIETAAERMRADL